MVQGNHGAVVSGLRGEPTCPFSLEVAGCTFSGCGATGGLGEGGALAIFNTETTISDTIIEGSQGTGVMFESSSATGEHQLKVRRAS